MTTVITLFELLSLNPQTPSKMRRVELNRVKNQRSTSSFGLKGVERIDKKKKKIKKREIGKWICSQTQHKVVAFLDFVHLQAV